MSVRGVDHLAVVRGAVRRRPQCCSPPARWQWPCTYQAPWSLNTRQGSTTRWVLSSRPADQ